MPSEERKEPAMPAMPDEYIDDIDMFTLLTKNALKAIGIWQVTDLSLLHINDLKFIPLIGKKGQKSIIEFCQKHGITFNNLSYLRKNP